MGRLSWLRVEFGLIRESRELERANRVSRLAREPDLAEHFDGDVEKARARQERGHRTRILKKMHAADALPVPTHDEETMAKSSLLAVAAILTASCATSASDPPLFRPALSPPLAVEVQPPVERDGYVIEALSFRSPITGRVPAYLYQPAGNATDATPRPALLLQHGMPGDRSSMRRLAAAYARAGVPVLSLSAPYNRTDQLDYRKPRLLPAPLFDEHDRQEVVQFVRELRRAVDLLESLPGVDPTRIGYAGFSYGGWVGALLASVEPRLRAVVLMSPTGGFASWMRSQEGNRRHLARQAYDMLDPAERRAWHESIEPLEAERWIGRSRDSPLLVQAGREDGAVLPSEIERLFQVADAPKELRWYDAGHELGPEAFEDQAAFFALHLGFEAERFEPPDALFRR